MEFLSNAYAALKPRVDDDFIDRLNYYYSPLFLLIFAAFVSASQWVGEPIQCWVPAQFNRAWEEYTENYCFVQNTYWVSLKERIPEGIAGREERQLSYYQWVPFILALLALGFYFPYLFWFALNTQTGINTCGICEEAVKNTEKDDEEREKHAQSIATFVKDTIRTQNEEAASTATSSNPKYYAYGSYIAVLNIVCKFLFLGNTVIQLVFLDKAFGSGGGVQGSGWGFGLFSKLFRGIVWEESGVFPRVTFCDFQVKVLGNLHRHTIQCVLLINMFNEKIFIFLWYWTLLLLLLNLWNAGFWLGISLNPEERLKYIRKFLSPNILDESDEKLFNKFTLRFLRQDGVLVIRKINSHAGNLVGAKLLRLLFHDYRKEKNKVKDRRKESMSKRDGERKGTPTEVGSPGEMWRMFEEEETREEDDTTEKSSSTSPAQPIRGTQLCRYLYNIHISPRLPNLKGFCCTSATAIELRRTTKLTSCTYS